MALDPSATVAPDAVSLLIDTETGEGVGLTEADQSDLAAGLPTLRLPAEAFVRLVYGRLGPHRTPPVEADGVDPDDLRSIFPGF